MRGAEKKKGRDVVHWGGNDRIKGGRSGSSYRLTIASGYAYIYRVTQNGWAKLDSPSVLCMFLYLSGSLSLSLCRSLRSSLAALSVVSTSPFLSFCLFLIPKTVFSLTTSFLFLSFFIFYYFHGNRPKKRMTAQINSFVALKLLKLACIFKIYPSSLCLSFPCLHFCPFVFS